MTAPRASTRRAAPRASSRAMGATAPAVRTVAAYLAAQPPAARRVLSRVRRVLRPALLQALGGAVSKLERREKGTLRFPWDAPVPARLLARIARLREGEVRAHAAAKRARR